MKLTLLGLLVFLTACTGGGFGLSSGSSSSELIESVIIPVPSWKCGDDDCFRASYAMTGAGAGENWSYVPEAHNNYKISMGLLNVDLEKVDLALKEAGVNSCTALPTSGSVDADASHGLILNFKEPTFGFAMEAGSFLNMQKRLTVIKAGDPIYDIEIHCGSTTGIKTLGLIWLNGVERIHLYYRVETSSGAIELVGGQKDAGQNWLFGFKTQTGGGFRFVSLLQIATDYFLVAAQTDASSPTSLEYVTDIHSNPASTDSLNLIAYGTASGAERVCAQNYKNNVPTFSTTPADCHTSTRLAEMGDWYATVGMNSGTTWTTDYLSTLDLPDPSDY